MPRDGSAAAEEADDGGDADIRITRYRGEAQMAAVMGLIDKELSEPYTVFTYRYFVNQWPGLCFLAHAAPHDDTRPIGVVIGKLDRHMKGERLMRGYIGMVSIDAAYRGRGIATRLLHVVLAEMVKQGAQEIMLETEIDNVASLRLYERLGFMREKRMFNFYLNGKDCFRLILPIPASLWQPIAESSSPAHGLDTSMQAMRVAPPPEQHSPAPWSTFAAGDIL